MVFLNLKYTSRHKLTSSSNKPFFVLFSKDSPFNNLNIKFNEYTPHSEF